MYSFRPSITWLCLLLPVLVTSTNPDYIRILNLNYAVRSTDNFGYNNTYFFSLIDQNLDPYQAKLNGLATRGIAIVPAVGFPDDNNMNSPTNRGIAQGYSTFTKSIRLEIYSGYEATNAALSNVQDFITYLTNTLKFQHIILNAWPTYPNSGTLYPFKSAALEGSQEQNQASNYYPPGARTERVTDYLPSADILCNYEAPGNQAELASHPRAFQENAMQTTIDQINMRPAKDHLHWMAPFSTSYDPIKEGTYGFIVQKLSMITS